MNQLGSRRTAIQLPKCSSDAVVTTAIKTAHKLHVDGQFGLKFNCSRVNWIETAPDPNGMLCCNCSRINCFELHPNCILEVALQSVCLEPKVHYLPSICINIYLLNRYCKNYVN
jgi:hypothetical protein